MDVRNWREAAFEPESVLTPTYTLASEPSSRY
jgi:hypothetical protein